MFREGDEVEVWSKGKDRWLKGVIAAVAKDASPSVKVKFASYDKWLGPGELDLLRYYVPWQALADPEAPPAACIRALRWRYFAEDNRVGGDFRKRLGMSVLERLWQSAIEEVSGKQSTQEDRQLIHKRVKKSFEELGVRWALGQEDTSGSVDLCEWLHNALLLLHPPGPDAAETLAAELAAHSPRTVQRLVNRWMRLDNMGTGLVSKDDLAEAFRQEFWPRLSLRVSERMANNMMRNVDPRGLGQASYGEFALRCLGVECTEVVLYYYDLSNDWAKYLSPLLLGSWEGGLWHTGIGVFGREYFYGGKICWGCPAATVWGRPTRVERLGLTTRKLDDFRDHVYLKMDKKFDRNSYDVLEHNCNHFVDQAAFYLLGCGIPDEVRLQPQRVMSAPLVRMLRPLLNRFLGRVEEAKKPTPEEEASERTRGVSKGGA